MPAHQEKSRRPAAPQPPLPAHAPPAVRAATQGGGQALDGRTGAEMGARFGHDFSNVRIHADSRAGDAAAAMGANAYALGGDIVFGDGQYNPGSSDTERLLAHELTHVVQQSRFGPGDWGRASAKGDASEREADSLASEVMLGRAVQVQDGPQAALARDVDGDGISGALGDWMNKLFHMGPVTVNPIIGPIGPDAPDPRDDPRQQRQDDFNKDQAKQHGDDYPNPFAPNPSPGPIVPLPLPGPRVPQPDPPGDFMPPAQPDPNPPYMPPAFQYPIAPQVPPLGAQPGPTFPGLGQSDPIAPQVPPLGAQPGLPGPLPPPSLFPPASAPSVPLVPPLALDPGT